MNNKLLKYLNNQIIIWENIYGDIYTLLYDSKGRQRKEYTNDSWLYHNLREARAVMEVLKKIKRNRFNDIQKLEKKRYKIETFKR